MAIGLFRFPSKRNPSLLSEFKLVLNDSSVQQLFLYMDKYAQYTADRSDTYFGMLSSEKSLKKEWDGVIGGEESQIE